MPVTVLHRISLSSLLMSNLKKKNSSISPKFYCLHFCLEAYLFADPSEVELQLCYFASPGPLLPSLWSTVHRANLIFWPGICALYNLTVSCCSPNCSMFRADCAPRRCPSPVCALFPLGLHGRPSLSSPSVTVLPLFKAFLLSIPEPEISPSLHVGCTWFIWVYGICYILICVLLFMTCVSLLPC